MSFGQSADSIVRQAIRNELNADAADHTAWMYRETKMTAGKKLVLLTVDASQGTISETIEKDGQLPSSQEHQADLNRLDRMINSHSARHKAQASAQHDDQQAREFAGMLPDALGRFSAL